MAIEVSVEKQEWCVRPADPDDQWDAGDYDGRVSWVQATWSNEPADPIGWRGSLFDVPGVKLGDTVYVVVADYTSGSTFGTSAGSVEVLDVFASADAAFALARAAEAFSGGSRSAGTLAAWEFEHGGKKYYASWLGYFENLKEVRVWDCFVRPAR